MKAMCDWCRVESPIPEGVHYIDHMYWLRDNHDWVIGSVAGWFDCCPDCQVDGCAPEITAEMRALCGCGE